MGYTAKKLAYGVLMSTLAAQETYVEGVPIQHCTSFANSMIYYVQTSEKGISHSSARVVLGESCHEPILRPAATKQRPSGQGNYNTLVSMDLAKLILEQGTHELVTITH